MKKLSLVLVLVALIAGMSFAQVGLAAGYNLQDGIVLEGEIGILNVGLVGNFLGGKLHDPVGESWSDSWDSTMTEPELEKEDMEIPEILARASVNRFGLRASADLVEEQGSTFFLGAGLNLLVLGGKFDVTMENEYDVSGTNYVDTMKVAGDISGFGTELVAFIGGEVRLPFAENVGFRGLAGLGRASLGSIDGNLEAQDYDDYNDVTYYTRAGFHIKPGLNWWYTYGTLEFVYHIF